MKQDDIDRLFSKLEPVNPSQDLATRIVVALRRERRKSFVRGFYLKIALMGSGMALFGLSFFWAIRWLIDDLSTSGIYQFLSMLTVGLGSVIPNIDDLLWAILESLPITSLIAILASALVILVLLRQILSVFSRYQKGLKSFNHQSHARL